MSETVTGAQAVRDSIAGVMRSNSRAMTFGLGANDPGRVFGTTTNLLEEFGSERVFEGPTSELAMTGVGVGLAVAGFPVIHSHQRMDFALLAMDQLVNSAAKWKFMFGDQFKVPYLVRMIIGRGWGQGPTHSQNLESWLAHTPGLRVLVPATPQDLSDSIYAIQDTEDPIVVIEHRWLHSVSGPVLESGQSLNFLSPVHHGASGEAEVTIVVWGLATFDCLSAKNRLLDLGIDVVILQLRELDAINFEKIKQLISASRRVLVVSNSWGPASFADSVLADLATSGFSDCNMSRVVYPHSPEPTALNQLKGFHVSDWRVANAVLEMLGKDMSLNPELPVDQPAGYNFGPF